MIAIVGVFLTRLRRSDRSGMTAINRAFFIAAGLSAVLVAIAAFTYLPGSWSELLGDCGGASLAEGERAPVAPRCWRWSGS